MRRGNAGFCSLFLPAVVLFMLVAAAITVSSSDSGVVIRNQDVCPREPLCVDSQTRHLCSPRSWIPWKSRRHPSGTAAGVKKGPVQFRHTTDALRFESKSEVDYTDKEVVEKLIENSHLMLENSLIGQEHVLAPLMRKMQEKILFPEGRSALGTGGRHGSSGGSVNRNSNRIGPGEVLHFAGDNGVGKTLSAALLGKIISKHCRSAHQQGPGMMAHLNDGDGDGAGAAGGRGLFSKLLAGVGVSVGGRHSRGCATSGGDALLVIQGSSFQTQQALFENSNEVSGNSSFLQELLIRDRNWIIERVTNHILEYPHGIILLDDFNELAPQLINLLHPLLGRADYFPEQEDIILKNYDYYYSRYKKRIAKRGGGGKNARKQNVYAMLPPLSYSTVIITTDLGKEGRTRHKTLSQVEAMVKEQMKYIYGSKPLVTETFVFQALSTKTARKIIINYIEKLVCTLNGKEHSHYNMIDSRDYIGLGSNANGGSPGRNPLILLPKVHSVKAEELLVSHILQLWESDGEGKGNGHDLISLLNRIITAAVDSFYLDIIADYYGRDSPSSSDTNAGAAGGGASGHHRPHREMEEANLFATSRGSGGNGAEYLLTKWHLLVVLDKDNTGNAKIIKTDYSDFDANDDDDDKDDDMGAGDL